MSRHYLLDRSDHEVSWYQRRSFLTAAAAWTATGGFGAAQAQSRSNIVELQGDVLLNGTRLLPQHTIQSGDQLSTGPGAVLVFVVGNAAFHVRQNTQMAVERGDSINAISILRLFAGAVASAWGRGERRMVITPTLTAGIRGTGVYTEVSPKDRGRSYFCNCYGTVDLTATGDSVTSQSEYHQGFWAETEPKNGRMLTPAGAINHTDEEMEALARLVGERTAWQIKGRKGQRDGRGYTDMKSTQAHPLQTPRR
jgi:hypothetical protein